jgi:flagellar hook-associated protein 3 FlgL
MSSDLQERGLAKNLDAKQAEFFKGTRGNVNTELYQMLTLEDESGGTYYLDTNSGYLFSKAFVDEGYKDVIAAGNNYITDVDIDKYAVGKLTMSEDDALNAVKSASADDIAAVVNGKSKDNDLKCALRRINDSENVDEYISEIATATGASENDVKSALKNCADFANVVVSNYFDNRGIIKDSAQDGITVAVNGKEKNLNFTTIMQRVVTYSGDNNHISMVKLNGATDTRSDVVNVTGQDIYGCDIFDDEWSGNEKSGTAMLNNCITVYEKANACDAHWLSSDGITLADVSHATLTVAQTTLGSRLQLYGNVEEMLDNQNVIITGDITNLDSTDVAELATKLMEMTTIYNLALSLGGRVLPQSLADYL